MSRCRSRSRQPLNNRSSAQRRQHGLTLIEMVITIVILGIALVTLTASISTGVGRSGDPLVENRAIALGQSYLQEILARRFDENSAPNGIPPCSSCNEVSNNEVSNNEVSNCSAELGPEEDEAQREDYDDVDDYHGHIDDYGQAGTTPIPGTGTDPVYRNFRVEAKVRYLQGLDPTNDSLCAEPDELGLARVEDAKLITVTVQDRGGSEWEFSAYKANF